jgi:hypothetical protein
MIGGGWLDSILDKHGRLPPDATIAAMAEDAVCKQLGIPRRLEPTKVNVTFCKVSCQC